MKYQIINKETGIVAHGMVVVQDGKLCFFDPVNRTYMEVDNQSNHEIKLTRMNREEIARVCHQVNKAYCEAIGDFSQPTWEDAEDWMKESAINGVELHINRPLAGAEQSHESWMREKVNAGWEYGTEKDAEAKTHPCIVPFSMLPVEQQAKDFIFRAIVHALAGGKS